MLLKAQMDEEADNDDEAEQGRFELLLVFDKATSAVPAVAYKWRDVEIQCSEIVQTTCTVALTLAVAVPRLYDTPWLLPSWDLCDLPFLQDARGNYLLDRPYISFPIGTPIATKTQRDYRRRLVKNEIISALGVALIELSYAKALQDLTEASDLDENGNHDIMTEYATATRLAGHIHHLEWPSYAKATTRRINFNFEALVYDLNDQNFRGPFYEGVSPLRADWEYATG